MQYDDASPPRKMRRAPAMTTEHRQRRLKWVTKHIANIHGIWGIVVWSDE